MKSYKVLEEWTYASTDLNNLLYNIYSLSELCKVPENITLNFPFTIIYLITTLVSLVKKTN